MKTILLSLKGYKEWTESLGSDREWKIQIFQHSFSSLLYERFSKINSYVIPLGFDKYIILADGIKETYLMKVIEDISYYATTPIEVCKGYSESLYMSLFSCVETLDNFPDEKLLVAHYDIDGFTKSNLKEGIERINELSLIVSKIAKKVNGIYQYFGGDNFGVFASEKDLDLILSEIDIKGVKIGIGIGENARKALENATKALDLIRIKRDTQWKVLR